MTSGRLLSAVLAFAALSFAVPTVGQATLLDFQLTVSGSAGNLPETFVTTPPPHILGVATTSFSFSVTAPTQTTANPGDTIEVDLLAPAGLQFVVANPAGALVNSLSFAVGTGLQSGNTVATGTTSITGEGGSGTISEQLFANELLSLNGGWEANAGDFIITGTVSFTEISVQFLLPAGCAIPTSSAGHAPAGAAADPKLTFEADHQSGAGQAGVTLPLTALSEKASDVVLVNGSTDPGDFVSLEAIPTAVPEPASLALLGTALAGLGLIRRRRRRNV